jgi:hypothetical protein
MDRQGLVMPFWITPAITWISMRDTLGEMLEGLNGTIGRVRVEGP